VKAAFKGNPDRRFDLIECLAACLALSAAHAAA
jgi:hypothetical protein